MAFGNIYQNKKVLITGNTGFKGSWLTTFLLQLGAEVHGISKDIPTTPSMFEALNLRKRIDHSEIDIRDLKKFSEKFNEIQPDFVFHLAAQAIVSSSYENPIETLSTNIMGTANILETLRLYSKPVTVVMITSDKAYDNVEWIWGYRENDALGGKDVYSGSKGGAELVFKSYWHSFLKHNEKIKIGVARAGNVIGGGDWSKDRIIVDCIKALTNNEQIVLRSPDATRPWQHVLEPLSGYLTLGKQLYEDNLQINGEPFNFGPRSEQIKTVHTLVKDMADLWGNNKSDLVKIAEHRPFHEAGLLKLNCDKSLAFLKWHSVLNYNRMIELIVEWYKTFYEKATPEKMFTTTQHQISQYCEEAKNIGLEWAQQ